MAEHFIHEWNQAQFSLFIDALQNIGGGPKLDQILDTLKVVMQKENRLMATLDETLASVQSESAVDDSIVTLVQGLKSQLDALLAGQLPPDAQAKVDAIFSAVEANKQKVADAVTANTPAA